jgi:hypothetical protein
MENCTGVLLVYGGLTYQGPNSCLYRHLKGQCHEFFKKHYFPVVRFLPVSDDQVFVIQINYNHENIAYFLFIIGVNDTDHKKFISNKANLCFCE